MRRRRRVLVVAEHRAQIVGLAAHIARQLPPVDVDVPGPRQRAVILSQIEDHVVQAWSMLGITPADVDDIGEWYDWLVVETWLRVIGKRGGGHGETTEDPSGQPGGGKR